MAKAALFTQVHLENWRNFTKVAADLAPEAVVIGPSASGKSNLLDAFRFLQEIASVGGGFQQAVRMRGGVPRLRCLAAGRSPDVVIRVRIKDGAAWEYEIGFTHSDKLHCAVIQHEQASTEEGDVFCRPDALDEADPERLTETYLEQSAMNGPVRELVEALRSVCYSNVIPALARKPGSELLGQIAGTPEETQRKRLRRILRALQDVVPQLTDLQMWRDAQGTPHLRARYEHWRLRGAWQTEDEFSDGTLRLIGVLWAALDGTGPLLLEEPELSLDAHIARSVARMVSQMLRSGRQTILTTHSTELLGDSIEPNAVLLLTPSDQGTEVHTGVNIGLIKRVMEERICLADSIDSEPPAVDERQIPLFEEE